MDVANTIFRLRKVFSVLWLAACGYAWMAALHYLTDFDFFDHRWWEYLLKYTIAEGSPPWRYAWYFVAAVGTALLGGLIAPLLMRLAAYGDARPARRRDIRKMELDQKAGVVVGSFKGRLLMSTNPRHSMVIAGTRSGKTQGIVIPTIFKYPGSIVVLDVKGELWDATAGARSRMSDCYRLEWTDPDSARFNPLASNVLPEDPSEVERRVAALAAILGPSETDYFAQTAVALMNILILLEVFDARHDGREALLTNVAHWTGELDDDGDDERDPLGEKMLEAAERATERAYPRRVASELREFAKMSRRQRDGVVGTFSTAMSIFRSSAVEQSLSAADVTPASLVTGDRPVTLYIVTKAADLAPTAPLTTALISDIIFSLVSRTKAEAEAGHSLLLLLEEFSALRKTPAIEEAYVRGAGMGVQLMTVLQSFSQIEEKYGRPTLSTFMNNTDWIVAFSQNDEATRTTLEKYVGTATRRRRSKSEADRGGGSVSESLEGVPLIRAQDWGTIPFGEHRVLVKFHHTRPIFAKTPLAYKNSEFNKLMKTVPSKTRIEVEPYGD